MRAVVQRVGHARVMVDDEVVGRIGVGFVVLLGVANRDTSADVDALCRKLADLRIFPGRTPMDASLLDVAGACLVISQFTLCASVRKGRRPSFDGAAAPEVAFELYTAFVERMRSHGVTVQTGRFGAHMQVELVNDGPVTLVLTTRDGSIVD